MSYFNRRNNYQIEYSGHEDVSPSLRERLALIVGEFTHTYVNSYGVSRPRSIYYKNLAYAVQKEFPSEDPLDIISRHEFYKVFTVIEIFWDLLKSIDYQRCAKAYAEIINTFRLSGSVYSVNLETGRIELVIEEDLAEKIKQTETALAPYENSHKIFFEAVGNLFGKKAKPKDIVRDIYVAVEEYLKIITGESQYSSAIKKIHSDGVINGEQKSILEKLYAYRSNTEGTTHAGDKDEPREIEAIWFIDTMSAQLRYINSKISKDK